MLQLSYDYEVAGHVYVVPLHDIYVDPDFNCRGAFAPHEVHGLGQSISEEGQRAPIVVQPLDDVPGPEQPLGDWTFRLIAGHRRYMAIDKWSTGTTINCVVERGLTREQACTLNFSENLQRKDLNILEEARALHRTWPIQSLGMISKLIGKPKKWIHARRMLLQLPDYVQTRAASNGISQYDILMLAKLPPDRVEAAYEKLTSSKGKTGRRPVVAGKQKWRNRPRGINEISKMVAFLLRHQRFSELSEAEITLVTSTLVWVTKGIDAQELLENRFGFPEGSVAIDSTDEIEGMKD